MPSQFTKPDLIPDGSRHDKLLEVFDKKRFALGHVYFVVKNLNQAEIKRGFTYTQARFEEHKLFGQGTPWSTAFTHYQHRFGTLNLQGFLSGTLAEQMTRKLPIIDQEINARLEQVLAKLREYLDPSTHNAPRIILDVVLDFSHNVRKELEAEFLCKAWRNNWKLLQEAFFDALASMKPIMSTSGSRDATVYIDVLGVRPSSSASKAIAVDDKDNNGKDYVDDRYRDILLSSNPETPTKKRKLGDTLGPSPAKAPGRRGPLKTTKGRSAVFSTDFSELRKKFFLDQVTQHLAENFAK